MNALSLVASFEPVIDPHEVDVLAKQLGEDAWPAWARIKARQILIEREREANRLSKMSMDELRAELSRLRGAAWASPISSIGNDRYSELSSAGNRVAKAIKLREEARR